MPVIVASERTRRADARRDREAGKTPVEGREGGTGESAPDNEQAPAAQPEAAREGDSGQGQEQKPKTGWASEEERQAAIDAGRQRREAQEREERERGSNDNDPGRTREP